ncbi:hypothetical protein U9M48_019381 [Paspalum notatum var. saurae]|uniref:Protein LNK2 n=1 Tax=Paspalum notatum var. saurae TaxID=547442 RepID=A0AAQ3WQP7_PASNO
MFNWNGEQQQVGDAIWAEFNESENHIVPYPKGADNSMVVSVSVGDHENNDEEGSSIAGITEHSAGCETELQGMEKEPANQTSAHFSATRLDMELWPDLPSLNHMLDKNYIDDTISSTYLDFSTDPSLHKVAGNTAVQLDGESEVFGHDHEGKSNSFLDCDWGNVGDFVDFDRLFSTSDSIFGNEVVANDSDFLSASSDLMYNVQSILIPVADANAKYGEQAESKRHLTSECSGKPNQFSQEGDVLKTPVRLRRKLVERGKSEIYSGVRDFSQSKDSKDMGHVQHSNQFMYPGYKYPAYPFATIPLTNVQADDQMTPVATSYCNSADCPKHSSSIEKSQDIPSRPLIMTPQEKMEKLRRRQQMQALIAIQQQQQQFSQEGSGSDTMVSQAYSQRNKNPDSLGSSIVIDENTNKVLSPDMIPTSHNEVLKISAVSDDPFIEEKIYYQLQDALGKLDSKTRLCIRDSLLRLAQSARERQFSGDRSSTNKTNKDEDEASENDISTRRTRSPNSVAETTTNPIDRIVAHLLFHRNFSKVATAAKDEIITSFTLEPESKVLLETPRVPSEDHRIEQEMVPAVNLMAVVLLMSMINEFFKNQHDSKSSDDDDDDDDLWLGRSLYHCMHLRIYENATPCLSHLGPTCQHLLPPLFPCRSSTAKLEADATAASVPHSPRPRE